MWDLILKVAVKYLESHPEVIEQLVEEGVKFLLSKVAEAGK